MWNDGIDLGRHEPHQVRQQMRSKGAHCQATQETAVVEKRAEKDGKDAASRYGFRALNVEQFKPHLLGPLDSGAGCAALTSLPVHSLCAPQVAEGPQAPPLQGFVKCPSTDWDQWGLGGE